MSDRRRVSSHLLAALALASGVAQGQVGTGMPLRDPAIERANLVKLDSLALATRGLSARADSARMQSALPDTVHVGRFRIAATPEYLDFARDIARRAEARITTTLGPSTSTRMTFRMLDDTRANQRPRRAMLERWIDGRRDAAVRLRVEPGRLEGEYFLVEALAHERFAMLDSSTRAWLRHPLDLTADRRQERAGVYVELATSPNRLVRDCRSGRVERCREASAFERPEDPIRSWYDAGDRRRIGSRNMQRRLRDPNVQRCAEGNDAACIAELRSWAPSELPPPLSVGARHSLVWVALGLGGADALERFTSSTATNVEGRLAESARTSSASLIGAWRDSVAAARPKPVAASIGTAWAAVFWGGLLGVLAMRSSRWRAR